MIFDDEILENACLLISASPYPDGTKYYKDDIDTIEKIIEILKSSGPYGCRFTTEGYYYLIDKFTVSETIEIVKYYSWMGIDKFTSFDDLRNAFKRDIELALRDNLIINKDDAYNILMLDNLFDYHDKNLILDHCQIEMDYQLLFNVLLRVRDVLHSNTQYDEERIKHWADAFFMNKHNLLYEYYSLTDYQYENLYIDFTQKYIYNNLVDVFNKEVLINVIDDCFNDLQRFEQEKELPLYRRHTSDFFKESYLKFYRTQLNILDKKKIMEIKQTYENYLYELRDRRNIVGLETSIYTYYGSNKLAVNNYLICEEFLNRLVNNLGKYEWCGLYGDLYFYGRNERRKKDYLRAYNIYLMGALNNDLYSIIRIIDCIYHGYGGFINQKFAINKLKDLYQVILKTIDNDKNYRCLAFASFHLAEFRSELDDVKTYELYEYYLIAYCSILNYLRYNYNYLDEVFKERIEYKLQRLYKERKDDLFDMPKNILLDRMFSRLRSFRIDKINVSGDNVTIKLVALKPTLLIDLLGNNADITNEVTLSFKTNDYILNKDLDYYKLSVDSSRLYFIPESDSYRNEMTINIESSSHEEIDEKEKISDFYISFTDFSTYLDSDEIRDYINFYVKKNKGRGKKIKYLCAQCTYTDISDDEINGETSRTRAYTFIALVNNLKVGHVCENGVVVYVHNYMVLDEDELPVPYDEMKHIAF